MQASDKEFTLEKINIHIKKGSNVLFFGSTGSGKSALLHALMGELCELEGTKVLVNGSMEVSMQDPWIFQATIKENIVMNEKKFDGERYIRALKMSQLEYDMISMPCGHNTDIGEKGQTLSGG